MSARIVVRNKTNSCVAAIAQMRWKLYCAGGQGKVAAGGSDV
jgi:hypothetical protein